MSKSVKEYFDKWMKEKHPDSNLTSKNSTSNWVYAFAKSYADHVHQSRIKEVTEKDILTRFPTRMGNKKISANQGRRSGAKWALNLLKNK